MAKIDRLLTKASTYLLDGEQVLAAVQGEYPVKEYGVYNLQTAVLIATKSRLLVFVPMTFSIVGDQAYHEHYSDMRSVELTRDTKGHLITIEFRSDNGALRFRHIKDVVAAQNVVAAVSKVLDKSASPRRKAADDSVPKKLRQLADLHAEGILTDTEYASKKAELLQQM